MKFRALGAAEGPRGAAPRARGPPRLQRAAAQDELRPAHERGTAPGYVGINLWLITQND